MAEFVLLLLKCKLCFANVSEMFNQKLNFQNTCYSWCVTKIKERISNTSKETISVRINNVPKNMVNFLKIHRFTLMKNPYSTNPSEDTGLLELQWAPKTANPIFFRIRCGSFTIQDWPWVRLWKILVRGNLCIPSLISTHPPHMVTAGKSKNPVLYCQERCPTFYKKLRRDWRTMSV